MFWTREQQLPIARELMEGYLECWQALDGLWDEFVRYAQITWDTTKTDDERYAAWDKVKLLGEGKQFNEGYTALADAHPAVQARVRQEITLVRSRTTPPDSDLPALKGWLCDQLRHRMRERVEWATDGLGVGKNTPQEDALRNMAADVQYGLRTIRTAATATAARGAYTLALAPLDLQTIAGAPVFKRTNGMNLAPNSEGQRIISIAPTVKSIRLRVENPQANQGVIELDAGGDTDAYTQSIGATASNRATWRCAFTSPDPLTAGDHHVRVSVRNDIGPAEVDLIVRVADTAPAFDTARRGAQTFTVGTAERFRFGKATGGNGPLTYSMDAVPEGMAFDAGTRTLAGTPSEAAGATDYTCKVTDADGDEAQQAVSVTVQAAG